MQRGPQASSTSTLLAAIFVPPVGLCLGRYSATVPDLPFTEEVTALSGPNGHIDWLNCGFESEHGWQPPYIRMEDIVTHSLSSALKNYNSPFKACSQFTWIFEKYGRQYNIPPILLASFAMQESSCRPDVVGGGGEQGLMQISGEKCIGAPNAGGCRDPVRHLLQRPLWRCSYQFKEFNIRTAAKYFADTLKNNNGDVLLSVGTYNGWYRGLTKVGGSQLGLIL